MRRSSAALLLSAATLAAALLPAALPGPARAQEQPPHAWLFGTWTGGFFPVTSRLSAEACLSRPVVIFARDVVLRATLLQATLQQREVETVRITPEGAEIRFASSAPVASPLLGIGGGGDAVGFGCPAGADTLTVVRRGENEITFPGCTDFPNPLVRCPNR